MYFNQNEIGKRVRDLRRCRGLTIEKLSEELNYSHSHMSKAERGIHSYSVDLLIDLAEYFNVSLDFLILGKESVYDTVKNRESKSSAQNASETAYSGIDHPRRMPLMCPITAHG